MEEEKIEIEDLQEQYQDIAEIIGMDNLLALCERMGGSNVYIPMKDKLVKNITYKKVIEEFDGSNIKILARKYGISESTVYRLVRDKIMTLSRKPPDGQMTISEYLGIKN